MKDPEKAATSRKVSRVGISKTLPREKECEEAASEVVGDGEAKDGEVTVKGADAAKVVGKGAAAKKAEEADAVAVKVADGAAKPVEEADGAEEKAEGVEDAVAVEWVPAVAVVLVAAAPAGWRSWWRRRSWRRIDRIWTRNGGRVDYVLRDLLEYFHDDGAGR